MYTCLLVLGKLWSFPKSFLGLRRPLVGLQSTDRFRKSVVYLFLSEQILFMLQVNGQIGVRVPQHAMKEFE